MANPRKFSEKIALHHQKQAEETAAFEQIMREVSDATQRPEELPLSNQYAMAGGRSGGTSPSRSPAGQRGRASSSVGPMRRPADRRHDTSPYGSTVYLSPPPDSNWRRTNSDSALHQSCGVEQQTTAQPLSPHRTMHSHAHPHLHPHQNHHRRGDIHLDVLAPMNPANRPRSSCEIPRIPNNNNTYDCFDSVYAGGEGGGGLGSEMAVPGGSLPDLTSVHFPPPHYAPHSQHAPHAHPAHRASPDYQPRYNHLSVPNTNNYLHHNKNMSPLDHGWIPSGYQTHCSPPSQYSSTSNINIPSPTMVHSPGSPVESPQTDYNNLHQALLQPFEQITMLDNPVSSYNTTYLNHGSPHSPQTTNSSLSYPQPFPPCPAVDGDELRQRVRVDGVRATQRARPGGRRRRLRGAAAARLALRAAHARHARQHTRHRAHRLLGRAGRGHVRRRGGAAARGAGPGRPQPAGRPHRARARLRRRARVPPRPLVVPATFPATRISSALSCRCISPHGSPAKTLPTLGYLSFRYCVVSNFADILVFISVIALKPKTYRRFTLPGLRRDILRMCHYEAVNVRNEVIRV